MASKPLMRSETAEAFFLGGDAPLSADKIPQCRECNSQMSFILGHKFNGDSNKYLLVFQCQANPGMCDDWDPDSGANSALILSTGELLQFEGATGLSVGDADIESGNDFADFMDANPDCVGLCGGSAVWVQADETPACECGKPMEFVAQVDETAHPEFNFGGGGCGYVFQCRECEKAKFLWQS